MVMDHRDYERISGRSGDPTDRLAAALAGSDARHADNAERLQLADAARGLVFRGFGWPALFVQKPLAATVGLILLIGFLAGLWVAFG